MKLTSSQLRKIITESLENNSVFMKLDMLYNGSAKDLAQLRMILQSGTLGDVWLASKINGLLLKIENINIEIARLENLPFDPYYDDVIKMEINDFQYDASDLYKEINFLKNLKNKSINEMNRRQRNFNTAQKAYDNQEHPDFYEDPPPSDYADEDDIFNYAFSELLEYLVDGAIDEGILTQEQADSMSDEELIPILKQNFKSDLFIDEYDEFMISNNVSNAADTAAEDYADYQSAKWDDYDGDY